MLAKKEVEPKPPSPPPTFDLSSDSQWPSIAGMTTSGSGSGQRVWLSGHEMEGKGWNSIVKSAPSVKPAVKREAVSPHSTERSREEEESPVNSGETKKRQRKKRKKSGEGVAQPQSPREKKLDTSLLLDLSQYMDQAPVRPVLNKKDTKASKEAPGATGNVLDSTAPSVRRGKEREAPKPKKPTQLRKIIELEKAAKKQLREQGLSIPPDLDVMKGENEQSGNSVEVDPMLQTTPTSQLVTQTTPTFELMDTDHTHQSTN
jgi:selenocysteine insertion sequence-binding protein 2